MLYANVNIYIVHIILYMYIYIYVTSQPTPKNKPSAAGCWPGVPVATSAGTPPGWTRGSSNPRCKSMEIVL